MLTTCFAELIEHGACDSGLETLRNHLYVSENDMKNVLDIPIPLATILQSNGLEHAIWSLRTQSLEYSIRFAELCVEHVSGRYTLSEAMGDIIRAKKSTWYIKKFGKYNPAIMSDYTISASNHAQKAASYESRGLTLEVEWQKEQFRTLVSYGENQC